MTSTVDASPLPLDISSEKYREYTYADGNKFRIENPTQLFVLSNSSHRVVDKNGVTHRPERGFLGISWLAKEGQPKFVA